MCLECIYLIFQFYVIYQECIFSLITNLRIAKSSTRFKVKNLHQCFHSNFLNELSSWRHTFSVNKPKDEKEKLLSILSFSPSMVLSFLFSPFQLQMLWKPILKQK